MTSGIPAQNLFDFMAGAKAAYEEFHRQYLGSNPPKPWGKLTETQQRRWVAIAKAATKEAMRVAKAKSHDATTLPIGYAKSCGRV